MLPDGGLLGRWRWRVTRDIERTGSMTMHGEKHAVFERHHQ